MIYLFCQPSFSCLIPVLTLGVPITSLCAVRRCALCLKWAVRLDDVWRGKPRDSLDLALVDVRENYPTLPIAPFKVLICLS